MSAGIADRFDHVRFTVTCAIGLSIALVGAIAVPSLSISIALFAVVGIASGPIFPMIQAIGGERYADRSAARRRLPDRLRGRRRDGSIRRSWACCR